MGARTMHTCWLGNLHSKYMRLASAGLVDENRSGDRRIHGVPTDLLWHNETMRIFLLLLVTVIKTGSF